MISLSNITKQYGRQVLFVDTSFKLRTGEKIGLVGPNGSGKTTIFRMISGEEQPDGGEVSIPRRTTIGYFRQDVETMGGNSALIEAIAGSGRLGELRLLGTSSMKIMKTIVGHLKLMIYLLTLRLFKARDGGPLRETPPSVNNKEISSFELSPLETNVEKLNPV